ncbi:MAG TPA: GNAT family N-acetyltransferase [Candidatus Acidoferrales bacterium]|jgi:ribosomal protein S18 acetylase RimI-like enzyme
MAIEVKVLRCGDEKVLMNVAAGVFDNPINPEFTREFLEDKRHHIAVAIDDGVVVGFASGVHYIHPDKPPELWINEVGVAPTHRRRGLGKAVMCALLEVGRANKCKMAWVLTDRHNAAAMRLYASIGGTEGADDSGTSNVTQGYSFDLSERCVFGASDRDTTDDKK